MFFCAFLGHKEHGPAWRETVHRHAAWLGLSAHLDSLPIADGRVFAFGWVSLRPPKWDALVRESPGRVTVSSLLTLSPPDEHLDGRRDFESNTAQLQVSLETGEARVSVPIGSLEEFCYVVSERSQVFSNDLRLLARWQRPELDERGVYSVLTCHTVPPTLTLFANISRVPQGHVLTVLPHGNEVSLRRFFRPPEKLTDESPEDAVIRMRETLDDILAKVPPRPVVFFSGGVDSGLVAARLAAQGRQDVTLLTFSTRPDDPESAHALRMAKHLGLPCEQIVWDADTALSRLDFLAEECAFPVDDPAFLPTLLLVMAAAERAPQPGACLDGAGVGGLSSSTQEYQRWKRIYAVPAPIRRGKAAAFQRGLWRLDAKPTRLAARFCKSVQQPLDRGIALQSYTSHGIAYSVPTHILDELNCLLRTYQDIHRQGFGPEDRVNIIRIQRMRVSGGRTFEPVRRRGIQPIFPFVEPQMLRLCFALPLEARNIDGVEKDVLKRILAESVPREWVHRPKRPFPSLFRQVFSHPVMQEFVGDVVLNPQNPLMDLCDRRAAREVAYRAATGKPMTVDVRRFLWTLVFLSGWLQQLRAEL